ncbi:MAG: glycosyltransferase [Bacteroidetes bacterium]|nr:MAG: glycosyltransferase [Bacteroidota bacterium]
MPTTPLKILHLAKWYPNEKDPQNGVFVKNQIIACKGVAEQAVLYWGTAKKYKCTSETEDGIPTIRHYFPEGKRLQNTGQKWSSIRRLINEVWKGQKPDVIHLHIADNDQWIMVEYAKASNIPIVLTEHWSGYLDHRFQNKKAIAKALTIALLKRVNVVTTVSGFLADAMIKASGRNDIEIVPNVVDTESIHSQPPQQNTLSFGVLADLDDNIKNISGTLRAFRNFKAEHSDATLHIMGGGKDEQRLKDLSDELQLGDAVIFHGRLNHHDSLKTLNDVQTVIVNSRRETFSVVCLEAIALGKKLICTRCGGPETFLRDELVIWSRVDDDLDLLRCMRESTSQPYPTIELKMLQVEPFLPEVVANQWLTIYSQLASSR